MAEKKETKAVDKELTLALSSISGDKIEIQHLLESGAIPSSLDTPEKLMTVIKTGEELGMGPMTSINNINVIKGRTVVSAAGLGALMLRNRIEFIWTKDFEKTEDGGNMVTEAEFEWISIVTGKPKTARMSVSWNELTRMGLTDKPNYEKYPKQMMRARTLSNAAKYLFSNILLGVYLDFEIAESTIPGFENEKYKSEFTNDGDLVVERSEVEEAEVLEDE